MLSSSDPTETALKYSFLQISAVKKETQGVERLGYRLLNQTYVAFAPLQEKFPFKGDSTSYQSTTKINFHRFVENVKHKKERPIPIAFKKWSTLPW